MEMDQIIAEFFSRWEPLSDEQKTLIKDSIRIKEYKRNGVLFKESEAPNYVLFLLNGKVKIYKEGIGHNQIVRVIKTQQMFGYRPYFCNELHRTTAIALERTRVVQLPIEVFEQLIEECPHIALSLIRQLSKELGKADQRTINLTQKHIRARLAEALVFLKDNYGLEEDESTLSIYLTREDLANLSNMTTSNAIRTLSAFASEKLITIDGRKIKLIQEEQLRKISRMG